MSFERKYGKLMSALIISAMLLASCSGVQSNSGTSDSETTEKIKETTPVTVDTADAEKLTLSESTTIDKAGKYLVAGTISDGQLTIDAGEDDDVTLILDGVSITNSDGAAIYVKQVGNVTISLAEGSENTLISSSFSDDGDTDAAVYAKDDLTLNGAGKLTITSTGGHGVNAKDTLVIESGTYEITAENHAVKVKDSLTMSGGALTLVSGKDGIHAENKDDTTLGNVTITGGSLNVTSDGDGVDTAGTLTITGGDFGITTGGGSPETISNGGNSFGFGKTSSSSTDSSDTTSMKAFKSDGELHISGGTFRIDAYDDSVHSNSSVTIDGGDFDILTGDDGFHADETLTINDGTIVIGRCYEGLEGKDVVINGGDVTLTASDDGINAAGDDSSGFAGMFGKDIFSAGDNCITINGGTIRINASGDGIDSNGDFIMTGGEVCVSGPTSSADGALDYNGNAAISGGIIFASGAQGMAQNFGSDSTQPSVLVTFGGTTSGEIRISDSEGNVVASYTPEKEYQCVVISHPDLKVGETYTVTGGDLTTTVELTDTITGSGFGGMGGGFGPGGFGGGGKGGWNGDTSDRPELPDGATMPDGMTPPDGSEMPDGMTPPDGAEMPDGMTPPDGNGFPGGNGNSGSEPPEKPDGQPGSFGDSDAPETSGENSGNT